MLEEGEAAQGSRKRTKPKSTDSRSSLLEPGGARGGCGEGVPAPAAFRPTQLELWTQADAVGRWEIAVLDRVWLNLILRSSIVKCFLIETIFSVFLE